MAVRNYRRVHRQANVGVYCQWAATLFTFRSQFVSSPACSLPYRVTHIPSLPPADHFAGGRLGSGTMSVFCAEAIRQLPPALTVTSDITP